MKQKKLSKAKKDVNTQSDHENKLSEWTSSQADSNSPSKLGSAINVGEKLEKNFSKDKIDVNTPCDQEDTVFKLTYPEANSNGTIELVSAVEIEEEKTGKNFLSDKTYSSTHDSNRKEVFEITCPQTDFKKITQSEPAMLHSAEICETMTTSASEIKAL